MKAKLYKATRTRHIGQSYYDIVKKLVFFPDRTEFPKIPDFSCSHCVKRVFYSAFV